MDVNQFKEAFTKIRNKGFIETTRRGPTGVGDTLEKELGLAENNIAVPDLGDIELKAHRINSNSMITLFTFNRRVWNMKPLEAVRLHGTKDSNGRVGMYFTMTRTPNSSGLFINIDTEQVSVRSLSGNIIALWKMKDLAAQFTKKIPALILVSALSEERIDKEYFHYTRAQLMSGTSEEILYEQLQLGNIMVDLRLHDAGTMARNHGTGFRTFERNLSLLFSDTQEL